MKHRAQNLLVVAIIILISHTAIAANYQISPIEFPDGIQTYLTEVYNHPHYAHALSGNFSHLVEFLDNGARTQQNKSYFQSIVRLFTKKVKSCTYVQTPAFMFALRELNSHVAPLFNAENAGSCEQTEEHTKRILFHNLKNRFDELKSDPIKFISDVSVEIAEHADAKNTDDISAEELRKSLLHFMHTGISKLVWNVEQPHETWLNTRRIARIIEKMYDANIIIDIDDVNDLYDTLLERYIYCIDIMKYELPSSLFALIKRDIASQSAFLLTLEEQEAFIKSKAERLFEAVSEWELKICAYEKGILVKGASRLK